MNLPDEQYVYHGSHESFDTVVPKRQIRSRREKDGTHNIIFDQVSFHATPYKWIALAYTFIRKEHMLNGKVDHYKMGVDLYDQKDEVEIYGFGSLEESLKDMYGEGGYLFIFEKEKFSHIEGLGTLEVMTTDNLKPFKIDRIDDPVAELKKLGIKFRFIDLELEENKEYRD